MAYIVTLLVLLFVTPGWGATYSVSTLLHSGIVEERLREADDFPRGGKVLFGEVIIRNDTADIAWVATTVYSAVTLSPARLK
jgi:hypothetical protein